MAYSTETANLALAKVVAVIAAESLTINTFTLAWNLIMNEKRIPDAEKAMLAEVVLHAFESRLIGLDG